MIRMAFSSSLWKYSGDSSLISLLPKSTMTLPTSTNPSKTAINKELISEFRSKSKDFTLYKSIKLHRDLSRTNGKETTTTPVPTSTLG